MSSLDRSNPSSSGAGSGSQEPLESPADRSVSRLFDPLLTPETPPTPTTADPQEPPESPADRSVSRLFDPLLTPETPPTPEAPDPFAGATGEAKVTLHDPYRDISTPAAPREPDDTSTVDPENPYGDRELLPRNVAVFDGVTAKASSTAFNPIEEKSYLTPEYDPETDKTYAALHTTPEDLIKFRYAGFISGNTLTEKVIYELGQVVKRNFLDQKYDLSGDATQPATDRAADENEIIHAAQLLLDKLCALECLINAKPTPENLTLQANAYANYQEELRRLSLDTEHPHRQVIAQALIGRDSKEDLGRAPLDAVGEASLGEKIRRETDFILSCVRSHNFTDAQSKVVGTGAATSDTKRINLFAGAVGVAAKKALSLTQEHAFPLTLQPSCPLVLASEIKTAQAAAGAGTGAGTGAGAFAGTPVGTLADAGTSTGSPSPQKSLKILLKDFMPLPSDVDDLVHMQRFATYVNHGEKPSRIPALSSLKSSPLNPALRFRRTTGINHPTNTHSGLEHARFLIQRSLATALDNTAGLFTGIGQSDFSKARKLAMEAQFSREPSDPAEHREWTLLREVDPSQTVLNKVGRLTSTTVTKTLASTVYGLDALRNAGISLSTNNALVKKFRSKTKQEPRTQVLNILKALERATEKRVAETEERARRKAAKKGIHPAPIASPFGAASGSSTGPATSSSTEETVAAPASPDLYTPGDLLTFATDTIAAASSALNQFALENPTTALLLVTSLGIMAVPSPVKALIESVIEKINLDLIAEKLSAGLPSRVSRETAEKIIIFYLSQKLSLVDASNITSIDIHKVLSSQIESLPSLAKERASTPEDLSRDDLSLPSMYSKRSLRGSTPRPKIDDMLLQEIEKNFDHIPFLSQMEKDDLFRNIVKIYPGPEYKDLRFLIAQQCQISHPITIAGIELPRSALSESFTHAVQHVTQALDLTISTLGAGVAKITRKPATELKISGEKEGALLYTSGLYTAKAAGTVWSATAKTVATALEVPVGATDQAIMAARALRTALKSSDAGVSVEKATERTAKRAQMSSKARAVTSKLSARVKAKSGVHALEKRSHGVMTLFETIEKAHESQRRALTPSSTSTSPPTATSPLTSPVTATSAAPRRSDLKASPLNPARTSSKVAPISGSTRRNLLGEFAPSSTPSRHSPPNIGEVVLPGAPDQSGTPSSTGSPRVSTPFGRVRLLPISPLSQHLNLGPPHSSSLPRSTTPAGSPPDTTPPGSVPE